MTEQLTYYCKVTPSGEFEGLPTRKFRKEVAQLFGGRSIEITVTKKKKKRSVRQNSYYWLLVTMISDHTGFTKEEVHAILKQRFLKVERVNEVTGAIYEYVRSTTELSTVEYEDYLEDVRRFASEEFGIYLPEPQEQMELI